MNTTFHVREVILARLKDLRAIICIVLTFSGLVYGQAPTDGIAPEAVLASKDGRELFITEKNKKQIAIFNIADSKVTRTTVLPEKPTGLALSPDESRLYVTTESPDGLVFVLRATDAGIESKFHAGHTPCAPVVSPDGKKLYVCNEFNNNISVLDTASGKELEKLPVQREPVANALTPDGKILIVANLLTTGTATANYVGAAVSIIHLDTKQTGTINLPDGSSSVRGVCISPDGGFAYAVHCIGHYQQATTQVEHGWMNTAALSIIDINNGKLLNTVLLDDDDLGAANPWGVACSSDGKFLCVTHAGTHEVSVIDRRKLYAKLNAAGKDKAVAENVPNDLYFMSGIRTRIKLGGNGPRGIALIGNMAYIAEYFSDSIAVVDISSIRDGREIAIGPKTPMSTARRGEMLFHDATLCFQHWQSCSSCHPNARVDGLNWDLLNDGIGNPKNTKSMLLVHKTPPAMWLGVRDSAELAVRSGLRFIEFAVLPEEDAAAIDAYLKSLEPVPSPHLVKGNFNASAERGKKVFKEAGCIDCHAPPLFSSKELYDLHLATGMDKDKPFTVPTLIEVWRTAPYLHDGRAATIREVLTTFNKGDSHGTTTSLTEQELNDLIEYVLSL